MQKKLHEVRHGFVTRTDVDMLTGERSNTESYRPVLKGLLSQDNEVTVKVKNELERFKRCCHRP
eukprot:3951107-Amphidinium_carterae.1